MFARNLSHLAFAHHRGRLQPYFGRQAAVDSPALRVTNLFDVFSDARNFCSSPLFTYSFDGMNLDVIGRHFHHFDLLAIRVL